MSNIIIHDEKITPKAYIYDRMFYRAKMLRGIKEVSADEYIEHYLNIFALNWKPYYERSKKEAVQEFEDMSKEINSIFKKKLNALSNDDFFTIIDEFLTEAEKNGYDKSFNTSPEYHVLGDLFDQQWKNSFSHNLYEMLRKRIGKVYYKLEEEYIAAQTDREKWRNCWAMYRPKMREWFYRDIMKKVEPPLDLPEEKEYMKGEIPF